MLCQEERCSFGIPRDLVRSLSLHELFSEFRNFDIDNWYFWKVTKTDFLLAVSEGFNILPPTKGQIVMICCWTSSKIFFYIFLSWHWYIGSATNNKNQKHFVLLPISLFTFQLQQTEVSICGLRSLLKRLSTPCVSEGWRSMSRWGVNTRSVWRWLAWWSLPPPPPSCAAPAPPSSGREKVHTGPRIPQIHGFYLSDNWLGHH